MWPQQALITKIMLVMQLSRGFHRKIIYNIGTNLEGFIENWISCLLLDTCFELGFFAGIRE